MGRPAFEITDDHCEQAKNLARQGLTKEQIASCLGISYQTLQRKEKAYSQFSQAIADGKAEGIQTITNALFDKASEGDVPAIKYFLNNRDNDNWKDKTESIITNKTEYDPEADERRIQTLIDLAREREESSVTKH